jgi:hypothetical protein
LDIKNVKIIIDNHDIFPNIIDIMLKFVWLKLSYTIEIVSQQLVQTSPVKGEMPATAVATSEIPETMSQTPVNKAPTKADQWQATRHARKQARVELVRQLH